MRRNHEDAKARPGMLLYDPERTKRWNDRCAQQYRKMLDRMVESGTYTTERADDEMTRAARENGWEV